MAAMRSFATNTRASATRWIKANIGEPPRPLVCRLGFGQRFGDTRPDARLPVTRELALNTPAHAVLNLLALGRRGPFHAQSIIVAGALLPDVPMVLFYSFEKVVKQTSEVLIWTRAYYEPGWQVAFDGFHSIPLLVLGLTIAGWRRWTAIRLLFSSMLLHAVVDLPLHHDDAHRHFFPVSDWRFQSPVSYWDPSHHGGIIGPIEAGLVAVGCVVLYRSATSLAARCLVIGLG